MEFNTPLRKRGRRRWPSGSFDPEAVKSVSIKATPSLETPGLHITIKSAENSAYVIFQPPHDILPSKSSQKLETTR